MSPVVLGGIATAIGGALLVGVGIAAGRWSKRREVAWWEDTYADLADRYRTDLQDANTQIAEALRIIADLTQQNLDGAGADGVARHAWLLLPPRLREAQEHWESN